MTVDEMIAEAGRRTVVEITPDELERLLGAAQLVRDDPTGVAGPIRTLRYGGRVLVQERNPEGELFVRSFACQDVARRFVDARLAAYERMWDG